MVGQTNWAEQRRQVSAGGEKPKSPNWRARMHAPRKSGALARSTCHSLGPSGGTEPSSRHTRLHVPPPYHPVVAARCEKTCPGGNRPSRVRGHA